ncbi:cupin domain-containing protein [Flavobacterium sp. J27]|uniref:(R)-mandelonitrile lyase n=1 Tax=Flavobacterium sp. J27 TaxID=2060419 RepID=UPI001F10E638|nr:cupin domain-containing protein [Flavobacterium sp. J27]
MKKELWITTLFVFVIIACNNGKNQEKMENQDTAVLYPKGQKLPNNWFSGNAFIHPLLTKDKNNEFSIGSVTFEVDARTHWHTHPKGQVLLVTEGIGLYQEKGKSAQIIKKGDVIVIPENIEHWHGATANSSMKHIAITNFKEEEQVTWLSPVLDSEFNTANKQL